MAKIAAMGAHLYQAGLFFGMLILVAHRLAPSDYTAYSFFMSVTQFGAIACFEWIRFAISRFYPGPTEDSEAVERKAILLEVAAGAVICLIVAALFAVCGVPPAIALLGGLVSIFQGGTDLHLTMLRFRQQFRTFAWLQGFRATVFAIGTLAGVLIDPRFEYAAIGMVAGYLVYIVATVVALKRKASAAVDWDPAVTRKHLVYGSVAASASIIGLLTPLGLKSVLTSMLGAQGAAGAMLALDLLQRPFVLVVSALQAIQYPDVVALYDRDRTDRALRRHLGQYYALLASFSFMVAAGIFAVLRPVTALIIAPGLQQSFMNAAPFIIIAAVMRALTQVMLPTPSHLRHHLPSIFLLAATDCVLVNGFAVVVGSVFGAPDVSIMAGAAVGAGIAACLGIRVLMALPFELTWPPVLLSVAGLAVSLLATLMPVSNIYLSTSISIAGGGLFCLMALRRMIAALRYSAVAG